MANNVEKFKYRLKVAAGPDYSPSTHQPVEVNGKTVKFESSRASVEINVHIKDYAGYPDSSPSTSPYFTHPLHEKDQYSISSSIIFKEDVNGNDLIFGNDFDYPIRDILPIGFNAALKTVKWTIDPCIEGDGYADKPYLYSPALATWNQFRVGGKGCEANPKLSDEFIVEEGAESDGASSRDEIQISDHTAKARRHHFQDEGRRRAFHFEAGRLYMTDFGNGYISLSDFSVRLPGFSIPVVGMVDDKLHQLRYTLKNRVTGEVYYVVVFDLVKEADPQPEGSV